MSTRSRAAPSLQQAMSATEHSDEHGPAAKRLRREEEQLCKTVLFLCGRNPWKTTVRLPRGSKFSTDQVKKALRKDGAVEVPPTLPQGTFTIVKSTHNLQVGIFKFERTAACGTVDSIQHATLPQAIPEHKTLFAPTPQQPLLRVGYSFLFGSDQQYVIRENQIEFKAPLSSAVMCTPEDDEPRETERTNRLATEITSSLSKDYVVRVGSGRDSSHFTGGGDIYVHFKPAAGACVLGVGEGLAEVAGEETSSPVNNSTPPKKGEQRCAAIENKRPLCTTPPTHVTLQLQANMVLLCAKLLNEGVASDAEHAEDISSITCYGAQFGLTYPMNC